MMSTTLVVPDRSEELRLAHVQAQRAALGEQLDRLIWSPERLAEERQARLRELISTAKTRSSWHAARLADINPAAIEEHDLHSLPAMTKDDLMGHFDQIVTDPRLTLDRVEQHLSRLEERPEYLLERYQAVCSSGSTGRRGVSLYDWDAWVICYLGWFRYLLRDLAGQPFSLGLVAAGKAFHISRALIQTFADPEAIAVHSIPVTLPQPEIITRLNQTQPEVLLTYPSELRLLAHASQRGELRIAPRAVATGGEPLLPEIRQAAEDTFGGPVLNWWLCSEAGPLAIGCGHGPGLHLSDDLVVIEPVDTHGQPVPPGVPSAKVFVTNLYNPILPLIRYEITDQTIQLTDPCPCGSKHRLVADVHGRLDDTFTYPHGITVHPQLFRAALCHPAITEYQVRQTPTGAHITLRTSADINIDQLHHTLERQLRQHGLPDPRIDTQLVEEIPRQPTGKLKRFVPLT